MKRLLAALLLFTSIACEEPPPLPPPPPRTPAPKISLIPTTEQIKSIINQMDKATADSEISTLIIWAGDTEARASTLQALFEGTSDPRPKVKTNVSKAIQVLASRKIRDPRMVDALIGLLTDEDTWVRIESGRALGQFCDKKIVPVMLTRMEDKKDPEKVQVALEALRAMSGEDAGKTAKDWKKWWATNEATFEEKCNAKP